MLLKESPTILVLVLLVPAIVFAAVSHKHQHGKERTEDGAFSPRDHAHFDDEGLSFSDDFRVVVFSGLQ